MDEMDPRTGRGWAVLQGDELHGIVFFHQGDESAFVGRLKETADLTASVSPVLQVS
jgi:hypothetical protein